MRTSIATVCLSGGLVEKLHACAAAGFDGIEIMDADLVASFESPEEIRALCDRLGLSIDMFQPFRDFEGVDDDTLEDNLRRAEAKFQVMRRIGADLLLVCSNVATATIDDDEVAAAQLGRLADLAAEYGIRLAYEALAWGTYVDDYRHAWRIVQLADRPNLGVCLDSFHILSRGHDPADIEAIDGDKIFFLQLADAPALTMDVLSWSRHHRLFPGEGAFALTTFLSHVLRAGYRGPLSLEVFNDTFRQTDVVRTAAHARRSLTWLADRTAEAVVDAEPLRELEPATAIDFVEIGASDLQAFDEMLGQLGFTFRGRHRSKPVRLWTAGESRVILNEQLREEIPRLSGLGLSVPDATSAERRAIALGAPPAYRRTYRGEQHLPAVASPDGTEVYWNDRPAETSWITEFIGGDDVDGALTGIIDHVNLGYRWQEFDEAVLFTSSVLGLTAEATAEVPSPSGLVRSQVMRTADGIVRLPINMAPPTAPLPTRHIAVRTDDVIASATAARDAGLAFLPIPSNYYDDVAARFAIDPELLATLRDLHLLYDRDADGEFIHFYTPTIGGVFLEVVERRGAYDGYGAYNAPIRLAAQRFSE